MTNLHQTWALCFPGLKALVAIRIRQFLKRGLPASKRTGARNISWRDLDILINRIGLNRRICCTSCDSQFQLVNDPDEGERGGIQRETELFDQYSARMCAEAISPAFVLEMCLHNSTYILTSENLRESREKKRENIGIPTDSQNCEMRKWKPSRRTHTHTHTNTKYREKRQNDPFFVDKKGPQLRWCEHPFVFRPSRRDDARE